MSVNGRALLRAFCLFKSEAFLASNQHKSEVLPALRGMLTRRRPEGERARAQATPPPPHVAAPRFSTQRPRRVGRTPSSERQFTRYRTMCSLARCGGEGHTLTLTLTPSNSPPPPPSSPPLLTSNTSGSDASAGARGSAVASHTWTGLAPLEALSQGIYCRVNESNQQLIEREGTKARSEGTAQGSDSVAKGPQERSHEALSLGWIDNWCPRLHRPLGCPREDAQ